jgi:hypothetical protein
MEVMRNVYKILFRKPDGRTNLEYLDIDGRIILKQILTFTVLKP